MSNPVPGWQYIVKDGDTYESIAQKAYGDRRFALRIRRANQLEFLFGGDVLIIPVLAEDNEIKTERVGLILADKP